MLHFSNPNLHDELDRAEPEQLDQLDIGVVRMSSTFIIESYNTWEAKLSGLHVERVIGRQFFIEVAPCTNNFLVAQRFLDEPELDTTVDYVFTFKMRPTPVKLRLLQSSTRASRYVVVAPR